MCSQLPCLAGFSACAVVRLAGSGNQDAPGLKVCVQSFMGEQSVACPNEINAVSVVCVYVVSVPSYTRGSLLWPSSVVPGILFMYCSHAVFYVGVQGTAKCSGMNVGVCASGQAVEQG